jgi:RNA polymerase sigma-70 factor (ECF subfamily)
VEDRSDEVLLAEIARGDHGAEREFFERHRQRAYRTAYRLLGNEADALDATSDSFVKAFKSARAFRGESSARTWFYRIVVNTSLDLRRARRRTVSLDAGGDEEGSLGDSVASGEEGPVETAARSETSGAIAAAIARLDEKHRPVFVLAAIEEMSYREIAETLGISIGTVMSRLFYARKYLQKSLAKYSGSGK